MRPTLYSRSAVASELGLVPRAAARMLAAALLVALAATLARAETPAAAAPTKPAWVQKSDQNTQVLLDVMAKFSPEQAAYFGISGLDGEIFDLKAGFIERERAATEQAVGELEKRLAGEQDPAVKQDLEILIDAARRDMRGTDLELKYQMPYFSVSHVVFMGLRTLLDDQVPAERRQAALIRLRKYAGVEPGYQPIAELAIARIRERMDPKLLGPIKDEVDKELANGPTYVEGIAKLFQKYKLSGYQQPYAKLKKQLAAYDAFVKAEILPRARTDFRQPPELYAFALEQVGVDMSVAELQSRAKVSFREIQNQMQALAPVVAKQKGWSLADYRDVIRELKKSQLVGDAILPHYQARMREVEDIIRREKIVTLPARDCDIQLSSEAESAQTPAPNLQAPRMIGNTGERGVFKLPLQIPGKAGEKKAFDDFTHEAASWTLTAHEARPGHELQFSAMVEKGISMARAIMAFNSVNVEGWGLYAEAELQPYEPAEGQLVALQNRLMRAARAFLDPGLQLGTITRDEAYRVLREEVGLSDAMATQEVERYMFWAPGQATAYFVGYNRLLEIRADAERRLGRSFDRMKFNDFVLAQGMVPPRLLRKAVDQEFVPSQVATSQP